MALHDDATQGRSALPPAVAFDAVKKIDRLGFGHYQRIHFLLMASVWMPTSFQVLCMYFVDAALPDDAIRCLDADAAAINATISHIASSNELEGESASHVVGCSNICNGGPFELVDNHDNTTIASEFGLVCGEDYKRGIVGSAFFVGFMVGTSVIGSWSSYYGRRKTFWIALLMTIITGGPMCFFAKSYWMYFGVRCLTGFATGGLGLVSYVLAQELIGTEYLNIANCVAQGLFSLGGIILAPLAYYANSWRVLAAVSTLPLLLYLPFYWWLQESPSWLLANGRPEDSFHVLQKVAEGNGTTLDDLDVGDSPSDKDEEEDEDEKDAAQALTSQSRDPSGDSSNQAEQRTNGNNAKESTPSVFSPQYRWITLCSFFNWFTVSLVYYGLSLSAGSMGGDKYISFAKSLIVELPSLLIAYFLLEHTGRKPTLAGSFAFAGIACLGLVLLDNIFGCSIDEGDDRNEESDDDKCWKNGLKSLLALTGKCGITIAFSTVYIITFELYPPHSRSTVMGMCSSASRLGGIVAPMVALLGETVMPQLPGVVFGFFGVLSSIFTMIAISETKIPSPSKFQSQWRPRQLFQQFCCWCSASNHNNLGEAVEYELVDTTRIDDGRGETPHAHVG